MCVRWGGRLTSGNAGKSTFCWRCIAGVPGYSYLVMHPLPPGSGIPRINLHFPLVSGTWSWCLEFDFWCISEIARKSQTGKNPLLLGWGIIQIKSNSTYLNWKSNRFFVLGWFPNHHFLNKGLPSSIFLMEGWLPGISFWIMARCPSSQSCSFLPVWNILNQRFQRCFFQCSGRPSFSRSSRASQIDVPKKMSKDRLLLGCQADKMIWVVVSNIFYFHPYLGKWKKFD